MENKSKGVSCGGGGSHISTGLQMQEKKYRIQLSSGDLFLLAQILESSLTEDDHWKSDVVAAGQAHRMLRHFRRLLEREV